MTSIGSLCVGSFYSFIFLCYNLSPKKWTFSEIQRHTPPTVFNLKVSDGDHYEEERGAYYQLSQFIYKLVKRKKIIFKVGHFAKKLRAFQKIP